MLKALALVLLLSLGAHGFLNEASTYPFSYVQLKQSSIKNLKDLYCQQFPRARSCSQSSESEDIATQLYKCLFNPNLSICPRRAEKVDEYAEMKKEKAENERKRREIIERFVF